MGDRKIGPFIL